MEQSDPAVKAGQELTSIFQHLEVPCEVKVDAQNGKYVVATEDLPEKGTTLVEELPIVSWPTRSFLDMKLPFCFHCLRRNRGEADAEEKSDVNAVPCVHWTECALCHSSFCSDACSAASRRTHLLLCSALDALRSAEVQEELLAAAAAGVSPSSQADEEGSITPEAVARCAAWLVARIANTLEREHLSSTDLSSTSAGESGSAATGSLLVRQIFAQAAAPFNRLISAPDNADFAGIRDPKAWFTLIRDQMFERCVKLLTLATRAASTAQGSGEASSSSSGGASAPAWAAEMASAALSDETLRTFLGQLVLNAHAVNDYVLLDSAARNGEAAEGSAQEEAQGQRVTSSEGRVLPPAPADLTEAPAPRPGIRFAWVMKGAAVYSLLSTFNHSCEPNIAVTYVDGTHEIAIKTTRPIAKGEELHNTYIPLVEGSTAKERRRQLQGYFFVCQCPRCVAEDDGKP